MKRLLALVVVATTGCLLPVSDADGGGGGTGGGGLVGGGAGGGSGGGTAGGIGGGAAGGVGGGAAGGTGGGTSGGVGGGAAGGVGGGAAGGVGGGTAGGTGGGGFLSCTTSGDCGVADGGGAFCSPSRSCINQRCVTECGASRTCTADLDAGCLTCDGGTTCVAGTCLGFAMTGRIERSSCLDWPDLGTAMVSSNVTIAGVCIQTLSHADGGVLGRVLELRDGTLLGDLPSMGGVCTASRLPTGIERWAFACPVCQFTVAWY